MAPKTLYRLNALLKRVPKASPRLSRNLSAREYRPQAEIGNSGHNAAEFLCRVGFSLCEVYGAACIVPAIFSAPHAAATILGR
jgi:hypothetical protein